MRTSAKGPHWGGGWGTAGETDGSDSGLSIYVGCAGLLLVLMVNTDPIVSFTSHSYR